MHQKTFIHMIECQYVIIYDGFPFYYKFKFILLHRNFFD